ncbi:MAG: hypothetical protein HY360_01890 [Verrucomicrobia bacterium]|nr:hypothetical protein [Verrucomicrobiota bacterium]
MLFSIILCDPGHAATNIVAFGDSITAGISADTNAIPYPQVYQTLLGSGFEVINKGAGGLTTLNLQNRFTNDVLRLTFRDGRKADRLIVLAGVNDIACWINSQSATNALYGPSATISRLRALSQQSVGAGIQTVVLTIWPDSDFSPAQRNGIAQVNAWILHDLTNHVPGAIPFDSARIITGQPSTHAADVLREYDDGGGLHLNRAGGRKMGEELLKLDPVGAGDQRY